MKKVIVVSNSIDSKDPIYYMKEAIKEAHKAEEILEVPIGAVIVKNGTIIARAHNLRETTNHSTHHAEILAINKACDILGTWRLEDCNLYVTLEPCPMCAGALILSRVNKVYFGAYDLKGGAVNSVTNLLDVDEFNHRVKYEGGIMKDECGQLLSRFFQEIRKRKKNKRVEKN
ncbi:tRNA adenosine(34) deaminase TadA [Haloplasma contractile]|uniref:tRNA-specific adenosine deaminase n=1 Tax=Haloplasma contractile SSD-17B TaxID=1033810 RepID=F7PWM9_9MOLU|nr:tRNA adenosine(34) deaminase TadA [Haloplasma contractile]ERJ12601.1 tRNA-specific adenosine deaminase protein [Haloplasma contractile SSD-17B]